MAESYYYARFFDEIDGRLDENYNNPRYDEIKHLLSHSRYGSDNLGNRKYLVNIVSGKTPKGIRYLQEGIPFLGSTHILSGKVNTEDAPRIAKEIHNGVLSSSKIKRNDVLITMAGTIGRSAAYPSDEDCNANQAVAVLSLNENEIDSAFLVRYLNSKLGQLFFGKLQHISSQPNINLEEIKRINVIAPKKTIQIEIIRKVKAVESQALKLDEAVENTQKEANCLLLKELGFAEIRQKEYFFKRGEDKSVCFYMFSDQLSDRLNYLFYHFEHTLLQNFQEKYQTQRLERACSEPLKRGEQPEYSDNGSVLAIKTINLKNSYVDYDNCLKVSKDFFERYPTAHVRRGDILIASTGYGSMGKIDIYGREVSAIADGHLTILRLKEGYDPYFVAYFLRSHLGAIQFEKWFSGSSGQIEIQPEDLNNFLIPTNSPKGVPLEKQKRIAHEISKKLSETSILEKKTKEKWMEAQLLFEKLILA